MNISNSECSSGCESGWTMYLDQSSNSADQSKKNNTGILDEDYRRKSENVDSGDDEDEDLSMVSDASSGPRHFHEDGDCLDETGYFCNADSASEQAKKREKKNKTKDHKGKKQHSHLDDTASSPVYTFSKKNLELSSNEDSTKQFKKKSTFRKHFGFLQSSMPGKPTSEEPSSYKGRKRE